MQIRFATVEFSGAGLSLPSPSPPPLFSIELLLFEINNFNKRIDDKYIVRFYSREFYYIIIERVQYLIDQKFPKYLLLVDRSSHRDSSSSLRSPRRRAASKYRLARSIGSIGSCINCTSIIRSTARSIVVSKIFCFNAS